MQQKCEVLYCSKTNWLTSFHICTHSSVPASPFTSCEHLFYDLVFNFRLAWVLVTNDLAAIRIKFVVVAVVSQANKPFIAMGSPHWLWKVENTICDMHGFVFVCKQSVRRIKVSDKSSRGLVFLEGKEFELSLVSDSYLS